MAYLEFEIPIRTWSISDREILLAKLLQIGFEGFSEDEELIHAYIPRKDYSGESFNRVVDEMTKAGLHLQYRFHETTEQNWNVEWEKKFTPVVIKDQLLIRAPFHDPAGDLPLTLVIEPKMSFGTGHHYTTRLMLEAMMELDLQGKNVLDMGCGTGVLGIYASLRGASRVIGIDYDQWAFYNALENVKRNGALHMEVRLGEIGVLGPGERFDVILANITRNTLIRDMPAYCRHLNRDGILLVSGILDEDVQFILNAAYRCGLDHLETGEKSNWISLSFVKTSTDTPVS